MDVLGAIHATIAPKVQRKKGTDISDPYGFWSLVDRAHCTLQDTLGFHIDHRTCSPVFNIRRQTKKRKDSRECRKDDSSAAQEWNAMEILANVLSFTPIVPGFAAPSAATMSFCPPILGVPSSAISKFVPDVASWNLETHRNGILVVTFFQGVFGIVRMTSGDVFGGIYALFLATLGYNSRIPGPAVNWLKTYVLITFINGTVGVVDLMQQALVMNYPVLSLALPLSINVAHFMTLAVPIVSFSGAFFGWEYIKAQKQLALVTRQREAQMQQPGSLPWPPPQLPPPEVLLQMQRVMDKAAGICPTHRARIDKEMEQQAEKEAKEEEELARKQANPQEEFGGLGLA